MEYKIHTLKPWQVQWQFELIKNFKIIKPIWKKSYWEDFFLTKSDSLEPINTTRTNILDIKSINNIDYVMSNDSWDNLNISIDWTIIYTWLLWESKKMLSMRWWYDKVSSGTITSVWNEDPTKDPNDVFEFWYIKLQLSFTPVVWDYITFTSNTTNLQWVTTKIHYVQSWYAYIRWTNLYWTLPTVWETVVTHNKIWDVLVVAEKNKLVAVYSNWDSITLYETWSWDEIIDIEKFNSTIFVLTKNYLFYWRSLVNCNINIYPLDFFDNMSWWYRIVAFGKHLVLLWDDNLILSPVNSTWWAVWYVAIDLNYEHKLFSKYSILSSQWAMYILQDDKQFVKVNIIATSNSEYDIVTESAMANVQWMLDDIDWDVYITKNDKYISIVNDKWDWTSISYNYNLLYQHWVTWEYQTWVKALWSKPFWDYQYQYAEWNIEQALSFELGWDNTNQLKTCYFVKATFVTEEDRVPDYFLDIDKYIWWMKISTTTSLKDFPINNEILKTKYLWDEEFSETGLYASSTRTDLWYMIQITIKVNQTADLFVFTLRNNNNNLTYWWSVIGYKTWLPEVSAYNYSIKSSNKQL